jgi:hypothetical protein
VLLPWLAAVGAGLLLLTVLWLPARSITGDALAIELLRCGLLAAAMAAASLPHSGRRAVALAALVAFPAAAAGLLTSAYKDEAQWWVPVGQFALIGGAVGFGAAFALGRRAAVPVALAGLAGGAVGGLAGLTPGGQDLYWVIAGSYYEFAGGYEPWRTQLGYVKWLWPQLAASAVIALAVVLARSRVARQ